MRRRLAEAACLAVLLLPAAYARAADALTVAAPWARASLGGPMPGVIFATIHGGAFDDRLLGVTTPVAPRATLHAMDMSGNMMRMRAAADFAVPAHGTLALDPDGDHVMLEGLDHPLHAGDSFPATFRFLHAGLIAVTVRVAGPGATAAP